EIAVAQAREQALVQIDTEVNSEPIADGMNEYLEAAHSTCKSPSPRKEEYLEKRHLIYQEKATNIEDASSGFPFTYKIDKQKDST
ncbi:Hypothetical predicted protein, partial [Paramuricea clavata]